MDTIEQKRYDLKMMDRKLCEAILHEHAFIRTQKGNRMLVNYLADRNDRARSLGIESRSMESYVPRKAISYGLTASLS